MTTIPWLQDKLQIVVKKNLIKILATLNFFLKSETLTFYTEPYFYFNIMKIYIYTNLLEPQSSFVRRWSEWQKRSFLVQTRTVSDGEMLHCPDEDLG